MILTETEIYHIQRLSEYVYRLKINACTGPSTSTEKGWGMFELPHIWDKPILTSLTGELSGVMLTD